LIAILLTIVGLTATTQAEPDSIRVKLSGLNHVFLLDATEVTVADYQAWSQSYAPNYADGNMPANGISFDRARAYCASRRMRHPTTEEWRRACSGKQQLLFSVTAEYDSSAARVSIRHWADGPTAVAIYPANDIGLYDMVGNVWEWVEEGGKPYLHRRILGRPKVARQLLKAHSRNQCETGCELWFSVCQIVPSFGFSPKSRPSAVLRIRQCPFKLDTSRAK